MKKLVKNLIVTILITTGLVASQDVQVYTADSNGGKITPQTIEKVFKDAGFYISGNNNMNVPFTAKFKKTGFDVYNLFTAYQKDIVIDLVKEYPSIGLFSPFSMSIYTKKGDKTISVSSLSLEGISKITKIPTTNKSLIKLSGMIKDVLAKAMPNGHFEKLSYKITKPVGELVSKFTFEIDATKADEIEEGKEDFQEEIEGELESLGFVVAGFNNLNDEFIEAGFNDYDFYDVYSICKIRVIYTVALTRPEAGAFAPCSLYMYKKRGESTVHLAWPSVANWISSLDIDDKNGVKTLLKAQKDFAGVLAEATEE
jgi:uncharacterized protein (DUF302 family)